MKTLKNENLKKHQNEFLNIIKVIENKQEDEKQTATLFDMFNKIEFICAFFTTITIISSIFFYEFQARINEENLSPDLVGYQSLKIYSLDQLKTIRDSILIVNSASVFCFSKVIFKLFSNYYYTKIYNNVQIE